jgi:hypothetical protein
LKRLIIALLALAALAFAAGAVARNYTGSALSLQLKAHKAQLKEVAPSSSISLHCDEGAIDYGSGTGDPTVRIFKLDPPVRLKHRRFHLVKPRTRSFAAGLDPAGNPIIVKVDFVLDASGKFNKRYSKASGTLRITGNFLGPKPNPEYPGQFTLFHNCDSGVVQWAVHRTGF